MFTFIEEHPFVRRLLGLLILAGGLICMTVVLISLVRDGSLWVFGKKTLAYVTESWAEQTSPEDADPHTFRYYVRYRFATAGGRVIIGTSGVNPVE